MSNLIHNYWNFAINIHKIEARQVPFSTIGELLLKALIIIYEVNESNVRKSNC